MILECPLALTTFFHPHCSGILSGVIKSADSRPQPLPTKSPRFERTSGSPNANFGIRNLWPQPADSSRSENISEDSDVFSRRHTAAKTGSVPFRDGNGFRLESGSCPAALDPEEPAEPCLRATRLSNLSVMSDLDLEANREANRETGSDKGKSCQPENSTEDGSVNEGHQTTTDTTVDGYEEQSMKLPPHLRFRKTPVGTLVNILNSPGREQKEPQSLPTFTLTMVPVGPLPGAIASHPSAAGETTQHHSKDDTPAARIVPTFSSAIGGFKPAEPSMMGRASIQRPAPAAIGSVVNTLSQWNNFAAQPQEVSNRPGRTAPGVLAATSERYNVPTTERAPAVIGRSMEDTLFFNQWPKVDAGRPTSKPRTIIITEMPEEATLAMVSRICKNTGLIETISLLPSTRRAIVWFIEAADAQKFHDRTGNGVVLDYKRGGKAFKKTVFIEMRKEIDVLASALRARVTGGGQSRVVRIVGWEKIDLEQAAETKNGTPEALLEKVAAKCAFEGKTDRIESVATHLNAGGHWEATIVFAGMKEALFALGVVRRIPAFEACNVTYGRDP